MPSGSLPAAVSMPSAASVAAAMGTGALSAERSHSIVSAGRVRSSTAAPASACASGSVERRISQRTAPSAPAAAATRSRSPVTAAPAV
nr:hypothetical protein GCM10017583_28160 [Agromyces mediolanus]